MDLEQAPKVEGMRLQLMAILHGSSSPAGVASYPSGSEALWAQVGIGRCRTPRPLA